MIPKTLQLHWLWDNPPPFMDTVVDRWTVMLPGWDIMVIRDVPFDFPSGSQSSIDGATGITFSNHLDTFPEKDPPAF